MQVIGVFFRSGWFSIPMYIVGTSGAKLGQKLRIASSSGSGWGRGTRICVHPL